jgi:hypothetical protein
VFGQTQVWHFLGVSGWGHGMRGNASDQHLNELFVLLQARFQLLLLLILLEKGNHLDIGAYCCTDSCAVTCFSLSMTHNGKLWSSCPQVPCSYTRVNGHCFESIYLVSIKKYWLEHELDGWRFLKACGICSTETPSCDISVWATPFIMLSLLQKQLDELPRLRNCQECISSANTPPPTPFETSGVEALLLQVSNASNAMAT